MADQEMSDADKIRAKRLAKLGGNSSQQSPTATAQSPPPAEKTAPGPSGAAEESSSSNKAQSNPFSQIVQPPPSAATSPPLPSATPTAAPKINITSAADSRKYAGGARSTDRKRSRSDSRALSPGPSETQPLDVWQDKFLRTMFRLSFDSAQKQDHHGDRLYHIAGVRKELESSESPLRMSPELLDEALIEAGSNCGPKMTTLNYLIGCWRALSLVWNRTWKNKPAGDERKEVVEAARRFCLNYCIYAVAIPGMFGHEDTTGSTQMAEHLLLDQENSRGLDHDFLTEWNGLVPEMDEAKEAFADAMTLISKGLASKTMNDDHRPAVDALRLVTRFPNFVEVIADLPSFLPDGVTAARLEVDSFLGPFFQISPLQFAVTSTYFASSETKDRNYIANTQEALRMSLRTHQTDLQNIIGPLIRRNATTRGKVLDWFALAVNLNHKRRAMQVDQKLVSSDGFMVNVTAVLDHLAEPIIDSNFANVKKIFPEYLHRKPRVDISDETKINADQKTSDAFYEHEADGQNNFISEVFFLTVASHHYGSEAIAATHQKLEKDLKHMEKDFKALEADRARIAALRPDQTSTYDRMLQRYKIKLEEGRSYKHSLAAILHDRLAQTRSMQFMRYVIVWMLHLVSPARSYPGNKIQLPLPEKEPDVFACLPEYFFDDVVSNFKFIARAMPDILTSTQSEELVTLCITFLNSSDYIKNPYLKAGLVTIMFAGTWPGYHGRSKGVLSDLLNSMPFCNEHLLHALMKFYIEVENTGAHTQFYDKFTIRFEIFQIIKNVWGNRVYKDKLEKEAKVNLDFFVRFVNLLINDVTYVLDESVTSLYKITEITAWLKSPEGSAASAEERQEKESALTDAEGKAKSYMQLTNETIEMLKLFTETLPESFTVPELVDRLASMLNYNLDVMVGPKANQLKVENMAQYGFNPRGLLRDIIAVYMNLEKMPSLIDAIAREGRSYKDENFTKATGILTQKIMLSPTEATQFLGFAARVKAAKEELDQADEDLGEIPDELLDPLMADIMTDPVILPTSKNTIDRSTIRGHLLSDPTDPFNRAPLRIEDVIPDVEMKKKIDAFRAMRKAEKAAKAAETQASGDAMDTS